MSGIGRGGRGALLLKALETPLKIPAQNTPILTPTEQICQQAVAPPACAPMGVTSPVTSGGSSAYSSVNGKPIGRGMLAQQSSSQGADEKQAKVQYQRPSSVNSSDESSFRSNSSGSASSSVSPSPASHSPSSTRASSPPTSAMDKLSVDSKKNMEKGTSGSVSPMCVNFIPFKSREEGAFQYAVTYSPEIESKAMRYKMLNEHRDVIGFTKAFDGSTLFLPNSLQKPQIELESKRLTDGAAVTITLTLVKVLQPSQCIQLYNILLRRIMRILDMNQVGRYYYDPKRPAMIPQHKLELWPGYVTSIQAYEGGVMLLADVSHRLLRTDSCLHFMYEAHKRNPTNFQNEVTKQLVGTIVLTRYNNRTYRIDDVAWDKNPLSKFKYYTGEELTYVDYYKRSYNTTIEDHGQPLLIHRPKEKKEPGGRKQLEIVCLVPELCSMTGLTDTMRADFRVMKDIAQHTRVTPSERHQAMMKFINNIYSNPEALHELTSWGLELDKALLSTEGRALDPEKVLFRDNKAVSANEQADWGKEITREKVITAVDLNNWLLIFTKRDQDKAWDFVQNMKQVCPLMGIQLREPQALAIKDDKTETYLQTIRANLNSSVQVVVCVFPTSRDDRYSAVKRLCCVEAAVPSQMINAKTISQANKLRSVTCKVALQINCKLGGELWALQIPMKNVMIIGIDTYHDAGRGGRSIGGFVASTNRLFTRWYSRCCFQVPGQELMDGLKICFTAALRKYHEENHALPDKIIVYRDGVGDGHLPVVAGYEVKQLAECFPLLGTSYAPKMAVVVVQKRITQRIFAGSGNQLCNPPPGSVLDHTITRKDWFDFFLVSQHVRQGTVTPTHYVVVYDDTGMKPDHFQRLTYKLTHLYYNWPGTIRVPAPCQYAHKLAFLVGQSLHKEPSFELSNRLFYL